MRRILLCLGLWMLAGCSAAPLMEEKKQLIAEKAAAGAIRFLKDETPPKIILENAEVRIQEGDEFDPLENIRIYDKSKLLDIQYQSEWDPQIAGEYRIAFTIRDIHQNESSSSFLLVVEKKDEEVIAVEEKTKTNSGSEVKQKEQEIPATTPNEPTPSIPKEPQLPSAEPEEPEEPEKPKEEEPPVLCRGGIDPYLPCDAYMDLEENRNSAFRILSGSLSYEEAKTEAVKAVDGIGWEYRGIHVTSWFLTPLQNNGRGVYGYGVYLLNNDEIIMP